MKKFITRGLSRNQVFRVILAFILDVLIVQIAWMSGLMIRFDFTFSSIPHDFSHNLHFYILVNTVCTVLVFSIMKIYLTVWKLASTVEMLRIAIACKISCLIQYLFMITFSINYSTSFHIIYTIVLTFLMFLSRFFYRTIKAFRILMTLPKSENVRKIMVIGAGKAASILISEFRTSKTLESKICCLVDDNPSLYGKYIRGIKVEGNRHKIVSLVEKHKIDEIIYAIPSSNANTRKEILHICKETNCELKMIPGIYQLVNGEVSVSKLRNVAIEDLLGRESASAKMRSDQNDVTNQVVMVTGGGGSIGSELCRQIAAYHPKQLIILDVYENNTYDIQLELKKIYPDLDLVVLIASVCNRERIHNIFAKYKPEIVYHAAAHKHVPLMEDSPCEAIENNVFGTYNTALAASKNEVKKFILISTDKAVNPTSIMGASKRICEMVIQMFTKRSFTEFVAVRFGNVLGSNGSVIPLFERQIREGGPVTVTHPNIVRYFMTINEAVSLVLLAGSMAKGGEIFVLDMGEPVKILDLARNMIRLSGYREDEDIKIKFTGLRPGEKLYEEKLMDEEGLSKTENRLIHIAKPINFSVDNFMKHLDYLRELVENDSPNIYDAVMEIVPAYRTYRNISVKSMVDFGDKEKFEADKEIAASKVNVS